MRASPRSELRRGLALFWGRRAAKALNVKLVADQPLDGLAKVMADTSTWRSSPPDFYALALVPIRVAAGAKECELYESHHHQVGKSPYVNIAVVNAISTLVVSLMADIGVAHTSVEDVSAPGADIASPDDLFRLVADMHGTVGSLPTAGATMNTLITGVLGDFGTRRSDIRKSSDAMRRLNTRFIEPGSVRLAQLLKDKELLADGQLTRHKLGLCGLVVQEVAAPAPATSAGGKRKGEDEWESWSKWSKADDSWWSSPVEETPTKAKLVNGGDRLLVEGGLRGPAGCLYQIAGDNGFATAVSLLEDYDGICPVYLACWIAGATPPVLHRACGNSSHRPGSAAHPDLLEKKTINKKFRKICLDCLTYIWKRLFCIRGGPNMT